MFFLCSGLQVSYQIRDSHSILRREVRFHFLAGTVGAQSLTLGWGPAWCLFALLLVSHLKSHCLI